MTEIEPQNDLEGQKAPASTARRALLFVVAALVITVDHLTKLYIENWLPLNRTWAPFPEYAHLFRITHVSNTGAAFGMFPSGSLLFTVIALIVAVVIVLYNYQLPRGYLLLRLALGLQLGGALGNLIDRIRLGHVTDFLDFGPVPVFNLADTAIVTGVIILGVLMLFEESHREGEPVPAETEDDYPLSQFSSPKNHEQAT